MKTHQTNPPLSKPTMNGWKDIVLAIGLLVLMAGHRALSRQDQALPVAAEIHTNPPPSKTPMKGWLAVIVAIGLFVLMVWILGDTLNDLENNSWGLSPRFTNRQIVAVFVAKIIGTVMVGVGVIKLVLQRSSRILNAVILTSLFGVAGAFIILFADVFKIFGLLSTTGDHQSVIHDPIIAVYFSVITWTTVGYGDFVPTESTRFFAAIEAVIGYVWMGLLVSVLAWILLTVSRESLQTKTTKGH